MSVKQAIREKQVVGNAVSNKDLVVSTSKKAENTLREPFILLNF
jgi:hypothetical protein